MKTITLQTAVLLAIKEFTDQGKEFSAYNITTNIRSKVDKEYRVSDAPIGNDIYDGADYTVIDRNAVKAIITELFENGLIDARKEYRTNNKIPINAYIAYIPNNTPNNQLVIVSGSANTGKSIQIKVANYLANCNEPVTLKQIQSALKIKGVRCEDIAKVIPYAKIVQDSPYFSKITVKA